MTSATEPRPAARPATATPRSERIDALRGLAIALVFAYHAGPLSYRLADYRPDGSIVLPHLGSGWLAVPFFHFGFVGVHLFFVLSGYCIHLRAARARVETGALVALPWRQFFLRRFFRIYPPYWIALALCAAAPWLIRSTVPRPGLADVAAHATMLHTFFSSTFFSINPAFWSIATEEQFYLGYPLVLVAMRRFGTARVTLAALALSLAWRAVLVAVVPLDVGHFMAWRVLLHGLFLPRWYDWLLGCLVAELAVDAGRPLAAVGSRLYVGAALALCGAMLARVDVRADKMLSDILFSTGFAFVVAAQAARTEAPGRLARALAVVGKRAYGVYLVHQPLLDVARLAVPLRIAVAMACSAAFALLVEKPFEAISRRTRSRRQEADA